MDDRVRIPGLMLRGAHAAVEDGLRELSVPPGLRPKLTGIRTLSLPATLASFAGIEQFPDLRVIRYGGEADVFSFAEPLRWLAGSGGDSDAFFKRLATNLTAFRQVSAALCAIVAPRMTPIQGQEGWAVILAALSEQLDAMEVAGGLRQDGSREYILLCRSYATFRNFQWCFELGRAISPERYDPAVETAYDSAALLTPDEQILRLLATAQGHTYEDFTGLWGDRRVTRMRHPHDCAALQGREIRWQDDARFQAQLSALLEDGLITAANYGALLEHLTEHKLTAATTLALQYGSDHPALRQSEPEDDFFL